MTLNQPAGHLEQNETILAGAIRELREETGIDATPSKLIKIYQWHAPRSQKDYLRFVFAVELAEQLPIHPRDPDIEGGFMAHPRRISALYPTRRTSRAQPTCQPSPTRLFKR
ncbi:phosphatase NudJ [Avibacterium gallinarum]|uniref:Phosphatase NudJ n=1 Tax=Avibacterium gallinarum TaxID=755 RepID=A0A379BXB6_AVIGA|nr:phosphatase NudJ [Avibacterium gallinarum]